MTPTDAKQLQPGDRLLFRRDGDPPQPCEVAEVKPLSFRIRWPEGGGMWVGFGETELVGRFTKEEQRP